MELTKEEYDKACQEQVDEVCLQNSIKQFRKWCAGAGQEVTYENFQNWTHEPYYEDLQRRLTREENEIEYQEHLKEDGYRRVTLSFTDKEPMGKWILRTNAPLKDNFFMFKCNGDREMFALIKEKDLPTPEFYLREDEDEEYTDEEYARMSKEKEDPYFHWYLHKFRIHCREKGMDDSCRYYTEWIKDHKNDSEYVPTTIYVKDGGYAPEPTLDENGDYIDSIYDGDPNAELPF